MSDELKPEADKPAKVEKADKPAKVATLWHPDNRAFKMPEVGALATKLGLPYALVNFKYTKEIRDGVPGTLCTATPK